MYIKKKLIISWFDFTDVLISCWNPPKEKITHAMFLSLDAPALYTGDTIGIGKQGNFQVIKSEQGYVNHMSTPMILQHVTLLKTKTCHDCIKCRYRLKCLREQ